MDIIVNVITSIIFSIIDVYLVNKYLYNKLSKYKSNCSKFNILFDVIIMFIINYNFFNNIILNLCLFILLLIVSIPKKSCSIKQRVFIILIIIFFKFIFVFLIRFSFEWIFDTSITIRNIHIFFSYNILVMFIERYIIYIIIINYINNDDIYFPNFKIITIFLYIYLGLTIIINNEALFYYLSIGRTFIFIIGISILSLIIFEHYRIKHLQIEYEMKIINQNIINEKKYLIKYNESYDNIKSIKHDLKNNYHIVYGYLSSNNMEMALKYMNKMIGNLDSSSITQHFGIPCIDSVIDDKIKTMKNKYIEYNERILPISIGYIEPEDIALIIGVALDNAIEATENADTIKEIFLEIKNVGNYLIINIENPIQHGISLTFHKTSKADKANHGFGIKKIKYFTKLYNGDLKYHTENDKVFTYINLSLKK